VFPARAAGRGRRAPRGE